MNLPEQIRKLAARPQGMCSADIHEHSTARVGNTAIKMAARGELHRVKLSHFQVRWFTDPLKADALRERVRLGVNSYRVDHRKEAPWPDDAPVVTPDHVKVQYLPSFTPRYVESVFPFVHGGLRCA